MEPIPTAPATGVDDELARLAGLAIRAARALGNEELARDVAIAAARLDRPGSSIVVVGEFKEGKSSLVNGLLGEDVCPVDDDIATAAVTVLRHGDVARAVAWGLAGDGSGTREVPLPGLAEAVTEREGNGSPAQLVEAWLPNSFLARGITLVDTPGVHGIRPGYSAVTLGYLRAAHAAVVVSDASAPLSHEELAFLAMAAQAAPATILALAKIDLYPGWREIQSAVESQLREAGIAVPLVPVSAALRGAALRTKDPALNAESGFPDLLRAIEVLAVRQSRDLALRSLIDVVGRALRDQRAASAAGIAAREAPETLAAQLRALEQAQVGYERLRQGNARWLAVLNDGFADLAAGVDYRFRRRVRDLQRDLDEELERTDPRQAWHELGARARERSAGTAEAVVRELETGADRIAGSIAELLAQEDLEVATLEGSKAGPDLSGLWRGRPIARPALASGLGLGLSGLRGAQGGLILFGMMAGLAGLALPAGAIIGVAAVFGGKQLVEERGRQLVQRRQQAKTTLRQFLDEAEFEISRTMRDLARELNRQLRDYFAARIAERLQTCTAVIESLQQALQEDDRARAGQLRGLRAEVANTDVILARLDEIEAGLAPGTAAR